MKTSTIIKICAFVAVILIIIFTGVFSKKDISPAVPDQNMVLSDVQKLTSSVWVWEKTQMNDDSARVPSTAGAFTLTFSPDGNVNGTTDCNSFFGNYTLEDTTITFGPFASTKMYCEGSTENLFIKDVETSQFIFFTEADDLVLLLPYDSGSVLFKKQ